MPLVSQTFDQLLDFTRTTSGTFVGSNGLIQTTPASVNLLLWTQQFDNAAWSKAGMTVTANSTTAPDGTSTADTLTATAGTGVSVRVSQSGTTLNATVYTVSFYVRPGTHTFVQIHINAQVADWVNFTLTGSGTVQNNGAAVGAISFDSATGYYRISATYTAGGTDRTPFFGLVPSGTATRNQTWNPVGTETVFIWGAQFEAAATATTYTRNNGGVFPPRFDYDPVTLAPKGILIEEQRTNLLLRSEEFDNASWTKLGATITANSTTSPDGTVDADTLVEDTSTGGHVVYQTASFVSGTTYTVTVFAKAGTRTRLNMINVGGAGYDGYFDLSNGTVISSPIGTAAITAAGNGWYRCQMTATSASTANSNVQFRLVSTGTTTSYTGDGTSGLFLYGAQLEAGAFATSYIPTVASQVTRTADQTSIVAPNFAPWYNQSEGTFVVDVSSYAKSANHGIYNATASIGITDCYFARFLDDQHFRSFSGGVQQFSLDAGTPTPNIPNKFAGAYKSGDNAASLNGGTAVTSAAVTQPVGIALLQIGAVGSGGTAQINGHIRSVRYYPVRLSNAQLQALTA